MRHNSVVQTGYRLVRLRNGACSVRSLAEDETFHPGIGPAAEAEALYVRQLHLLERVQASNDEFVIWDVGLGAAANALTAVRVLQENLAGSSAAAQESRAPKKIRLISFDQTCAAAAFALEHVSDLGYLAGFESVLADLMKAGTARCAVRTPQRGVPTESATVNFSAGPLQIEWSLRLGDFPPLLANSELKTHNSELLPPHAILFDPHSPKKNPAMWTVSLFANLFRHLDPERPCALATFTRSTMARVALLLGGFFVGVGHPSGLKEETTVAANRLDLLDEPLDCRWLERAKRSGSAEPLHEPVYRQAPLSAETWEQLRQHPQFAR